MESRWDFEYKPSLRACAVHCYKKQVITRKTQHRIPTLSEAEAHIPPSAGRAKPFLVADAVYLLMVYAFFITLPPLGRDYAALARPDSILFFGKLVALFGGQGWAYLLFNLALLYGCMMLILILTRHLTNGPWWLGSVAAVLFMANPVKTEAVLNISGIRELWPAFMALLTLLVYIKCRQSESHSIRLLPLSAYLIAILTGPINITLFAVIVALEYSLFKKHSRCWMPIAFVGIIALLMGGQAFMPGAFHPAKMFAPLFYVAYPIGMLPDTVAFFQQGPFVGYVLGVIAAIASIWLIRKINNPAFTFGILGAAAFRLCQGSFTVEPVTLAGGGQLMLPAALAAIAVAGFFAALLKEPRWRKSVVRFTTLLCIAAMCCQIWVNLHWRRAGQELLQFHQDAEQLTQNSLGEPVAVAPDIQYYRTAPMMLYESVKYRTALSEPLPVIPYAPINLIPPVNITIERYSPHAIALSVQGLAVPETDTPPLFSRDWWLHRYEKRKPVILEIEAGERLFSEVLAPF